MKVILQLLYYKIQKKKLQHQDLQQDLENLLKKVKQKQLRLLQVQEQLQGVLLFQKQNHILDVAMYMEVLHHQDLIVQDLLHIYINNLEFQ